MKLFDSYIISDIHSMDIDSCKENLFSFFSNENLKIVDIEFDLYTNFCENDIKYIHKENYIIYRDGEIEENNLTSICWDDYFCIELVQIKKYEYLLVLFSPISLSEEQKNLYEKFGFVNNYFFGSFLNLFFFNAKKIIEVTNFELSIYKDFFVKDNINEFRESVINRQENDKSFHLYYYNYSWKYINYEYCCLIPLSYSEILLYEKYSKNFNSPVKILKKSEDWYFKNRYSFLNY